MVQFNRKRFFYLKQFIHFTIQALAGKSESTVTGEGSRSRRPGRYAAQPGGNVTQGPEHNTREEHLKHLDPYPYKLVPV